MSPSAVLDLEIEATLMSKRPAMRRKLVLPSAKELRRKATLLKAYLESTYGRDDGCFMDAHTRTVASDDASALPKEISVEQLIAAMSGCRCCTCIICSVRDCERDYMQHGLSIHTPCVHECPACRSRVTSPRSAASVIARPNSAIVK